MAISYTHKKIKSPKLDMLGIKRVVTASAEIAAKKAAGYSKEEYIKEKVTTPKMPSMIFNSIVYDGLVVNMNSNIVSATSKFMVNLTSAPHAVYVVNDRRLRDGTMWSSKNDHAPYKFMDVGLDKISDEIRRIVEGQFSIIMR